MLAWTQYVPYAFDSLCLGVAWGALRAPRASLIVAALIGLCDASATLAATGSSLGVLCYVCLVLAVGALAWRRRGSTVSVALPVLLSIDNLIAPRAVLSAPLAGLASFVLALLGFGLSGLLLWFVPSRHRAAFGIVLAGASVAYFGLL